MFVHMPVRVVTEYLNTKDLTSLEGNGGIMLKEIFFDKKHRPLTRDIIVNPKYQRGVVWKHKQKIRLIESIANGYPIGFILLWKRSDKKYEILDGQQRITTIWEFANVKDKNKVYFIDSNNEKIYSRDLDKDRQIEFLSKRVDILVIRTIGGEPIDQEQCVANIFTRLQEGTRLNTA